LLSLTRNAEIVAAVNPAGSAAVVGELGGNPRFIRLVELIRKDMDKHARRKTKLEKKYGPASGFNRDHMLGAATAAIVIVCAGTHRTCSTTASSRTLRHNHMRAAVRHTTTTPWKLVQHELHPLP
jgi:hypothetical protein